MSHSDSKLHGWSRCRTAQWCGTCGTVAASSMSCWRTCVVLMSSEARQVLAEYGRRWKVMVELVLPSSATARSRSHLPVGAPRVGTVTGIGAVGAGPAVSSFIHGGTG